MKKKVMLILCDGMRPDSLSACGHPFIPQFLSQSFASLDSHTVLPSMTLPCHLSLMHSVPPERHGTMDNVYKPMVRPVPGLFDQLHRYERRSAFIYNWEQLRDLSRPGSLAFSYYISSDDNDRFKAHQNILDTALVQLPLIDPDFAFVYFGLTDLEGRIPILSRKTEGMETEHEEKDGGLLSFLPGSKKDGEISLTERPGDEKEASGKGTVWYETVLEEPGQYQLRLETERAGVRAWLSEHPALAKAALVLAVLWILKKLLGGGKRKKRANVKRSS